MHLRDFIRSSRRPTVCGLVPVLGFLTAACGGGGQDGESGDLTGRDVPISPETEDVYTVGALEGETWETFGSVSNVAFDRDENLYILDRDAGHVVKVSPSGEFLLTISQKGEGPGELTGPMGLAITPDDRVVVFDFAKRGFQVFTTGGEFVESVPVSLEDGMPGGTLIPMPDGRMATSGGVRISMSSGPGGVSVDEPEGRPIDTFGLDGSRDIAYTAWKPPEPEEESEAEFSSGQNRMQFSMQQTIAFEPRLHVDVLSDGRLAVVDSVGYRVKLIQDGTVSSTVERPIAPIPVTEEIQQRERDARLANLETGGSGGRMMVISGSGGGGGNFTVDQNQMNEMMRGQIEGMGFAESIPAIDDFKVDWEDRLWIERSAGPGETGPTDIVTADGTYIGTIGSDGLRIPAAFGPNGLMAYIERDELEVQRVRVARLTESTEALEGAR